MNEAHDTGEATDSTLRWALKAGAIILWVFLLVAGYFWAHKPFDAAVVTGLGHTLLSIIFWLSVTWLGAALGQRLVGHTLQDEWPFARLALTAGVGLGLLSLLLLILGLLGIFRLWAVGGLLLLLAVFLRRQLRAVAKDIAALRRPRPQNTLQRWFLIYSVAGLSLTFLLALAPPTAWDSLTYHLTGARFTVDAGRIIHPVDIPHLGFPLLGQMQYALGMLFLGDGPAALFHFGYGLMVLATTVALARRAFGHDAAWYSAAILLSIPTLFTLMSWPYVDATLLFYATFAFYAFFRWREARVAGEEERGWLVLLGLACGLSGSVKYTAVIIPVALSLSMAWTSRRDGPLALVRRLAPVAAISLLLVAPYLLENWLTTGNPLYPFFFESGKFWDAWRSWWYDRPGTGLAFTEPWRLPLVPLEVTILGTEGTELYEATVGPLLLLSLGLLVAVWRSLDGRKRAVCGHMFLFIGLNYLLWLNGVARTALLLRARFMFFIFGVIAALGGAALSRLPTLRRPQLDVSWIVQVVVAISLALILFTETTAFLEVNPLPATVGLETRRSYEARQLGVYVAVMERINELPPDAKVEFLWESRSYACQVECWPDPILDRFLHYTHYERFDAQALAGYWQRQGVTHVLLHESGLDFILDRGFDPVREQDLTILHTLQEEYLVPVAVWEDAYTLYEVTP